MFQIVERPISVDEILESVKDDSAGATLIFLGTVRDHNEGIKVDGIHYEAYVEMAEKSIAKIEKDTLSMWKIIKFAAVHRIGNLKVGEISVAIGVSSEHRDEAFKAGRYAIDRVKMEVPIWKKEKSISGSESWVEGTPLDGGNL